MRKKCRFVGERFETVYYVIYHGGHGREWFQTIPYNNGTKRPPG